MRTPEGQLLVNDLAQLQQLSAHLQARVRHGLVVQEILEEARYGDYDLVVIGAHRAKQWERFLLDDLAQQIVDHADRSVLVVRHGPGLNDDNSDSWLYLTSCQSYLAVVSHLRLDCYLNLSVYAGA